MTKSKEQASHDETPRPPETVQTGQNGLFDEIEVTGPYFELHQEAGKWHWTLWAANGRPMCKNLRPFGRRHDASVHIAQMKAIMKKEPKTVIAVD